MDALKRLIAVVDRWQRRHRFVAAAYGVIKKYSDDNAGLLVVALGWYGFTAIYPLLLVVVTILGFIGQASLGTGVVNELHQFPVIGSQFNPGTGTSSLHGSVFGLVIGIAGLLYGSLGVTQTAQQVMIRVWNIPGVEQPGFVAKLGRSLAGLTVIGGAFAVSASVSSITVGAGHSYLLRVPVIVALLVVNVGFFWASFRILTPKDIGTRPLLPGAILGSVGFTLLTTVGTSLVQHQLKHSTATYGALASVIGVVTYLLLLARMSVYAAELNPVLTRRLYPRALPTAQPTAADDQVLHDLAHEQRRRPDQRIGVGFGADSAEEAGVDASQPDDAGPEPEPTSVTGVTATPGRRDR